MATLIFRRRHNANRAIQLLQSRFAAFGSPGAEWSVSSAEDHLTIELPAGVDADDARDFLNARLEGPPPDVQQLVAVLRGSGTQAQKIAALADWLERFA